jgi:hypothetical protein
LSKKPRRQSKPKKRSAKRSAPPTRTRRQAEPPQDISSHGKSMTIEWGDITFLLKLTAVQTDSTEDAVTISAVPYEDTIHPHPLLFDPPLKEFAAGEGKGFQFYWEKLTYAFALPDPHDFPALTVSEDDRELMERFIAVCRQLAGYSVINDAGALRIRSRGGNWTIESEFPSSEAFGGTSIAFRQLHNNRDEASFDKIKARLLTAIKLLPQKQQQHPKSVLLQWVRARSELMKETVDTIVCKKVAQPPDGFPVSYRGINPETLMRTFNYGGTIHFGDKKRELVDLLADPRHDAYYKQACLISILALSHLYFGFALLIEAAIRQP